MTPNSRDPAKPCGMVAATGNSELDVPPDLTGMVPWDVDLDSWWTLNMFALDPQPLAGFDVGYL